MAAPKGNKFWKTRNKHGRDKIFKTPESLWSAACEYFEWVVNNPLKEPIVYQGLVTGEKSLIRAMTIDGLSFHLGVTRNYLTDFKDGLDENNETSKDYSRIIDDIYHVIREQKFTGAAAGLLNPNIIARDLGLADKVDSDIGNAGGKPFKTESKTTFVFTPVGSDD